MCPNSKRFGNQTFDSLADAGSAEVTRKGWLDLRMWGQQYFDGELDAENQPTPYRGQLYI